MDKHQNYADYADSMNNARRKKGQEKLRAVALHFQSTLQSLPALKQELDVMLQSTDALDYEALLQRVEPVLQQASDWLLKVDLLSSEMANEPSIQENVAKFSKIMRLSAINQLIQQFENEINKVEEAKRGAEKEAKREAERKAEEKRKVEEKLRFEETQKAEAERKAEAKRVVAEKYRLEKQAALDSLLPHYQDTLQQLPLLKQRIDTLDWDCLVDVQAILEQASDWLLKKQLIAFDLTNDDRIKNLSAQFSELLKQSAIKHLAIQITNSTVQMQSISTRFIVKFAEIS